MGIFFYINFIANKSETTIASIKSEMAKSHLNKWLCNVVFNQILGS
jgi:hypothetical protein